MNQHVNYATYIGWVLESMPQEIIDTHELQTITLDYRRECQHGDTVDSLTSSDSEGILLSKSTNDCLSNQQHNHGSGHLHFMHFLRLSGTGLEINRGRTIWRKLIRKWVMMNQDARELQQVSDEVKKEYLVLHSKCLDLHFQRRKTIV